MNEPDEFLHVTAQDKPVDDLTEMAQRWNETHWPKMYSFGWLEDHQLHVRPIEPIFRDAKHEVFHRNQWLDKRQELEKAHQEYNISQSDADEVSEIMPPITDLPFIDWDEAPAKAVAWFIPDEYWLYNSYEMLSTIDRLSSYEQGYIDENSSEFIFRPKSAPVTDEEWKPQDHAMYGADEIVLIGRVDPDRNMLWSFFYSDKSRYIYGTVSESYLSKNKPKTAAQIAEEESKAEKNRLFRIIQAADCGFDYMVLTDELYNAGCRIAQGEGNE